MLRVLRSAAPFSRELPSSNNRPVDFDFCRSCYSLKPSEHEVLKHHFTHQMVVRSMWLHPFRTAWIKFREQVVKMQLMEKIRGNTVTMSLSESNVAKGGLEPTDSNDPDAIGVCARCAVRIIDSNVQFYACGEYSCAKEGKH
jgi:hypothetical protein